MLQSAIAAQQATEARHRRESRLSRSRASGTATRPRAPSNVDARAEQHGDVFEADDDEHDHDPGRDHAISEGEEAVGTSSTVAPVTHEGEGVQRRKSRSGSSGKGAARGDLFKLSTIVKSPPKSPRATLPVEDELEPDDLGKDDKKLETAFPLPVLDRGRGFDRTYRLSTAFTPQQSPSPGPASGYSTPRRAADYGDASVDADATAEAWLRGSIGAERGTSRQRRMSEMAMELEERYQASMNSGVGGEGVEEGGYGWVVTFCAFTLLFLYLGILYSWGVYQAYFVTNKIASPLALSAVGGVQVFMQAIGCLPASYILPRLGQRYTVLVGICTVGGSLILCSFSLHSIGGLMFLHGITFGMGGALVYLTSYTAPSQWFDKKRGLCTGIASCGAGLGGAVYSVRLMAAWGPAWTYRFFGIITIVIGAPIAFLLRQGPITQSSPSLNSRGLSARPSKPIFKSSRFIRILVAVFIASYPFFIPPYFIPQYAQAVGLTAAQGALYNTLFNVSSAIGRIGFGVIADSVTGSITAWSLSILLIALSSLLVWPQALDAPLIILFVFLCGLGSGGFFTLQSSVVAQIIGLHRLHSGVSYLEVAGSFGFLAGPISAGALLDAFGGVEAGAKAYKPAIYLVGGATALSWGLVMTVRYSSSKSLWKRV